MSGKNIQSIRPFLSVLILIGTLFSIVFLQMEERRRGYQVLKLTKDFKRIQEIKRSQEVLLARITRPQLLETLAQKKFLLKKLQANQVIHLSGGPMDSEKKTN